MNFVVQRTLRDGTATLGELFLDSIHECYTLEPANPIPQGTYDLTIRHSPRFNSIVRCRMWRTYLGTLGS